MAEPGLIRDYLAALSAELPAPVVVELAGGLEQTHRHYLGQGLDPDAAARAAVAEFGEPQVVVAAFTSTSPARRAARKLLAIGPVVGACWGAALVINRAWAWPVPVGVRVQHAVARNGACRCHDNQGMGVVGSRQLVPRGGQLALLLRTIDIGARNRDPHGVEAVGQRHS